VSQALALRAASGDAEAFESLYREHLPHVYGLCLRMSEDEGTAAELTQDIFVKVWRELRNFRGGNIHGWIHTLGRNVILNDKRTRKRFSNLVTFEEDLTLVEPPGPRYSRETALTIEAATDALPPRGQAIFRMHDVDGYSPDEIAGLLGISVATVRVHLHRSRKRLAALLLS
jgi:RNA polymerase sigma factor (sigma-70 family)